ncbi:Hsp20 family protein [Arenibacter sp. M-2]|uniref:Hsp20 family protein n=1 Tax=Arenibacter sp. M-2 TaxID=3053612 RepID=UPI003364BA04
MTGLNYNLTCCPKFGEYYIPPNADPQKVQAKMKNGRLDIRVGKATRPDRKNRSIEIN